MIFLTVEQCQGMASKLVPVCVPSKREACMFQPCQLRPAEIAPSSFLYLIMADILCLSYLLCGCSDGTSLSNTTG